MPTRKELILEGFVKFINAVGPWLLPAVIIAFIIGFSLRG